MSRVGSGTSRALRIAMIGAKGVPGLVGGVERVAEELGARLAARGHEVTVYCRRLYTGPDDRAPTWRGMTRRWTAALPGKYSETLSHAATALVDAAGRRFDVIHLHSLGTAPLLPLARLLGQRVLFQIHGQEWRGGKWGGGARAYFRACEWPAMRCPQEVVVINRELRDDYARRFGRTPLCINNAVEIEPAGATGALAECGVTDRGYLLFVGRLVPEKGCHHLLEAHRRLPDAPPLLVVGEASHSGEYARGLRDLAGPNVRFAGVVTGARLRELYARSLLLVHPSQREGMSLVLLEAMAQGACVVASDIPEMREGLGGTGYHFRTGDVGDLTRVLARLLADPDSIERVRAATAARVRAEYAWEPVTDQYVAAYRRLLVGRVTP